MDKRLAQAARASSLEDIEAKIEKSKLQTPPVVGENTHALTLSKTEKPPAEEQKTPAIRPLGHEEEEIPGLNDDNLLNQDFIKVRNNILTLIEKGGKAVDKVVENINEESYPRHVESLADLIGTLITANTELIGVHATKRGLSGSKGNSNPTGEGEKGGKVALSPTKLNEMVDKILSDKVQGIKGKK